MRVEKLVRFVAGIAVDLLIPEFIEKPYKIAEQFYRCFLAIDPREQLALLVEADTLSPEQEQEGVGQIVALWRGQLPGALPAGADGLARQLLAALRSARGKSDPAEALR